MIDETPETDKEEQQFLPDKIVPSEFARKLERERNEAQRELKALEINIEYYKELYKQVKESRDKKNAEIAKLYIEQERFEFCKKNKNNS